MRVYVCTFRNKAGTRVDYFQELRRGQIVGVFERPDRPGQRWTFPISRRLMPGFRPAPCDFKNPAPCPIIRRALSRPYRHSTQERAYGRV